MPNVNLPAEPHIEAADHADPADPAERNVRELLPFGCKLLPTMLPPARGKNLFREEMARQIAGFRGTDAAAMQIFEARRNAYAEFAQIAPNSPVLTLLNLVKKMGARAKEVVAAIFQPEKAPSSNPGQPELN